MIDAVEARPAGFGARLRAWWSMGLAVHAALLALILVLLVPVVGTQASYSVDEGSMVQQVRALAEHHTWGIAHPLPAADPSNLAFPLSAAELGRQGWMPFARHPLYPELLAPVERAGGVAGMVLVSVAGTVLAALAAALIARRVAPGLDRLALWVVGLGSPLLFDSQTLWAHTIGTAAAGFAVVVALRIIERRAVPMATAALATALAVCVLLRAEGTLFGVAVALGLGVIAGLRRHGSAAVGAVVALVSTLGALKAETRWFAGISGNIEGGNAVAHTGGTNLVVGRIQGFVHTMLQSFGTPAAVLTLSLMLCFVVLGGVAMRRSPPDASPIRVMMGLAAAAALTRLIVAPPDAVPGLALAFPLLALAVVLVRRDDIRSDAARLVGAIAVAFWLAVLATQYPIGGSLEWGGRYFSLALPLATPLALAVVRRSLTGLERGLRVSVIASLAICTIAVGVLAVVSLRTAHADTAGFVAAVDRVSASTVAGDGDVRPVIVTAEQLAPRLAWATIEHQRWLLADHQVPEQRADQQAVVRRLPEVGVRHFVFVTPDLARDRWLLEPAWRLDEPLGPNGFEGWRIIVVTTA